jgi:hypothetical protein
MEAQKRMSLHKKMGIKINEEYFKKWTSVAKAFIRPEHSEEVVEIYNFIIKNSHYTVNRGVGLGMDVSVAPDMDKLERRASKKGIDIDRYEDYCIMFVNKQSEREQKKE